ncbi:Mlo-related protein [Corchorus olitorius]|uniref:MLO-like protein n=1 Tax=Corchorus olitorius TaxID=93759 RepID=A0A1R3G5E6_9ROSI|nr:Mlo-related protein [Corchorus olitorius]
MAGASGGRSLEETPTWAVAVVCFVLVLISIIIEHIIHMIGKWLKKKHKRALFEALEKVKSELMLLGFISLLLTVGQSTISNICISKEIGATWHPCNKKQEEKMAPTDEQVEDTENEHRRRLLMMAESGAVFRRSLAAATEDKCAAKMRSWKRWEKDTRTIEYQFSHDPERFRFARETSFGRRHLSFWTKTPVLMWIVCFFRQFVRSVPKVDYLTLRHGFIMIILLVGTKLQVIITKMGLRIQERGEVVKGVPVVQPGDDLFWFNRPRLILYLINFVLFQNAFQLAFFAWTWYEFGLKSCFHEHTEDVVIRISMGVLIQILCSYVTLPLYALVTQMGSNMKPTIFNEKVATALRNWHHTAKKHVKQSKGSVSVTPFSSRPATPSHQASPVHLLRNYRSEMDSLHTSPRRSNFDIEQYWDTDSPSPSHPNYGEGSSSSHHHNTAEQVQVQVEYDKEVNEVSSSSDQQETSQHEISIGPSKEFSFDKRTTSI